MSYSHRTRWILSLWALFLYSAPIQAAKLPRFHERLTWSAPVTQRGTAHYTLEYWAQSHTLTGHDMPTVDTLRTRLTRVLAGRTQIWRGKKTYTDPVYTQIGLAVAIRVRGQDAPQILVARDRDNWGDYELYRMDEHGLKEIFGCSHRDEGCIRWVSHKGALQRFVFIDRWDGSVHRQERGQRLQNRLNYRYNRPRKIWEPVSHRLETYIFDDQNGNLKNPVFQKPSDCPFRYRRARHSRVSKVKAV